MPRVSSHVSQGRGKTATCARCGKPIEKGQKYYKWSIKTGRGGRTYVQHELCGYPKQSQLTASKMSGVYAAVETAEETIGNADNIEDIRSALETCAEEVEGVKDEYQESLDNMPEGLQQGSTGEEIQEKIEALDTFIEELSSVKDTIEYFDDEEPEEPEPGNYAVQEDYEAAKAEYETAFEAWENGPAEALEAAKEQANEALGGLSI